MFVTIKCKARSGSNFLTGVIDKYFQNVLTASLTWRVKSDIMVLRPYRVYIADFV